MLQLYPVYLLCNRRKTLIGSPDPTRANGTNKPCMKHHTDNYKQQNQTLPFKVIFLNSLVTLCYNNLKQKKTNEISHNSQLIRRIEPKK